MSRRDFDSVAPGYDRIFTDSAIGRLQRSAVHHHLEQFVFEQGAMSILELGCGTGEDAVHFARSGHTVTATDASQSMLTVTDGKANDRGLSDRIQTVQLDLREPDCKALCGPFDLVFSNFGALNCIDDHAIGKLAQILVGLTSEGSQAVMVVMPRLSLWESLYFLFKFQPTRAFRRFNGGPISAAVGDESVTTWYYKPQDLVQFFQPAFRLRAVVPIGFAVPPSYLETWASRNRRILSVLAKVDRTLRSIGPLATISDHALIHLERT